MCRYRYAYTSIHPSTTPQLPQLTLCTRFSLKPILLAVTLSPVTLPQLIPALHQGLAATRRVQLVLHPSSHFAHSRNAAPGSVLLSVRGRARSACFLGRIRLTAHIHIEAALRADVPPSCCFNLWARLGRASGSTLRRRRRCLGLSLRLCTIASCPAPCHRSQRHCSQCS